MLQLCCEEGDLDLTKLMVTKYKCVPTAGKVTNCYSTTHVNHQHTCMHLMCYKGFHIVGNFVMGCRLCQNYDF